MNKPVDQVQKSDFAKKQAMYSYTARVLVGVLVRVLVGGLKSLVIRKPSLPSGGTSIVPTSCLY